MQHIIEDVQQLTTQLQAENQSLFMLIKQYTQSTCLRQRNFTPQRSSSSSRVRKIEELPANNIKYIDATNASRVSNSTVKQSSQRCKSSNSIKQSRITQKIPSFRHMKTSVSLSKKRGPFQQSKLLRLKKISQKTLTKIPSSVLLKKKSKIYHFPTTLC